MLNSLFYDEGTKKGTIVKNMAMSYCLNINPHCCDATVYNYHLNHVSFPKASSINTLYVKLLILDVATNRKQTKAEFHLKTKVGCQKG